MIQRIYRPTPGALSFGMVMIVRLVFEKQTAVAQTAYSFDWSGPEGYSITGATINISSSNVITSISGGTLIWGTVDQGGITGYTANNVTFDGTSASPFFTAANDTLFFFADGGSQGKYDFVWMGSYNLYNYDSAGAPVGPGTVSLTSVPQINGNALSHGIQFIAGLFLMCSRYIKRERTAADVVASSAMEFAAAAGANLVAPFGDSVEKSMNSRNARKTSSFHRQSTWAFFLGLAFLGELTIADGAAVAQTVYDFGFVGASGTSASISNGTITVDASNVITGVTGTVNWSGTQYTISMLNSTNTFLGLTATNYPFATGSFNFYGIGPTTTYSFYLYPSGGGNYDFAAYGTAGGDTGLKGVSTGQATVADLSAPEFDGNALSKGILLLVCFYLMGARYNRRETEEPYGLNAARLLTR